MTDSTTRPPRTPDALWQAVERVRLSFDAALEVAREQGRAEAAAPPRHVHERDDYPGGYCLAAAPDAGLRGALVRLTSVARGIQGSGTNGADWLRFQAAIQEAAAALAAHRSSEPSPAPTYDGFPLDVDAIHRSIEEAKDEEREA